ncbi:MAG TPA: hypothetical protein VMW07_01585 [Gallionella sp.]|nr:hypothetical protein [Gallionella sp.]
MTENSQITIYQSADGSTQIEVRLEQGTLWLSQAQMAELFDKDSDAIGLHLRNIYESGELDENATTEDSSVVRQECKRQVKRTAKHGSNTGKMFWGCSNSPQCSGVVAIN